MRKAIFFILVKISTEVLKELKIRAGLFFTDSILAPKPYIKKYNNNFFLMGLFVCF